MNRRVVLRATAATAGFLLGLVLAQAAVARERSTLPASGAEVARGVESVPDAFEERVRVAVERILGAVGTITAHASRGPRFGSAVVVDREVGLVVTSHHVVAGATKILFQPETGGPVEADLVRVDGDADLALLRARPAPHRLHGCPRRLPSSEQIIGLAARE